VTTSPSNDEQIRIAAILGPAYQGLMTRHGSNFAVQWQVFALGLTAQGFIVGAASQITGRPLTAVLLCIVILFIGAATMISGVRVGFFTDIDRQMLDRYERILLVNEFESMRNLHGGTFDQREAALPEPDRPSMAGSALQRLIAARIVLPLGPYLWWILLELVISIAGAAIPIFGIFRL
jgi:hypothetical protein